MTAIFGWTPAPHLHRWDRLADPRLWYPFAARTSRCPADSLGFGNTPPTLDLRSRRRDFDLSLYKEFRLGKEAGCCSSRLRRFNTFNHFNPNNPNTSLSLNFSAACMTGGGCTNTNANFGTITSAAVQARHAMASVRLRF